METKSTSSSYFWHFKRLLGFGIPLVLAQVLQMAIGVTDSVMVGRLGELPLAQVGLGSQYVFFAVLAPMGFSIAAGILIANAYVREDFGEVSAIVRMALWQAFGFFCLAIPFMWNSDDILRSISQPEETIAGATNYARILLISLPFVYASGILRSYLTALERGRAMLIISFLGFIANIIGNYVLIYGKFGFPALGLEGSAIASVLTNIVMALVVFWLCFKDPMAKSVRLFTEFSKANWPIFWKLLAIGAPTALGLVSETGMFQMGTIMAGWLGVTTLAAHTIVLNVAGLTFMIPLGLSIATSVRVGNAMGRGDREGLIKGIVVSYVLILILMVIFALSFWLAEDFYIGKFIDLNNPQAQVVAQIATGIFVAAAVFQIFDGAQVVGISALRGMQDVFIPSVFAFIAYWPIGVSMSYLFAFKWEMGGMGVWLGLSCGLATAAVFLLGRIVFNLKNKNFL